MPRPGPRLPSWTFRPSQETQSRVETVMLDRGISVRSDALNEILARPDVLAAVRALRKLADRYRGSIPLVADAVDRYADDLQRGDEHL